MKPIILCTLLSLFAMPALFAQKTDAKQKVLRHVVLFKFKDDASAADLQKVEDAFRKLKTKINFIKDFEFGKNNSPENLNQGFTHCFFVTFASEKDRDDYLVHADHKAFVALLHPYLDKALVVDYWARD
ncbi:MAG: Dabb family protein [Panacibacter sp.]